VAAWRQWLSSAQRRPRRRQWSLGGGSDCQVLSKELGGGSGRSEEAVRRRSCCHSKSDACKERGCQAEKVKARLDDSHGRD
jgi:hypothetical protein